MDIESKEFKRLVREIAKRNNTDPDIVRNVIISEFECARANMMRVNVKENFFPYIRLPYLFVIKVAPKRREYIINPDKRNKKNVHSRKGKSGSGG